MNTSPSYRVREPDVVHETIDGETVIVNLSTGNYYSLQGVGADVWALMAAGKPAHQIVAGIGQRYEGAPAQIEAGVGGLLARLVAEGLIIPGESLNSEVAALGATDGARPAFTVPVLEAHQDMQDLLLLDPIHDVDETGWPNADSKKGD